MIAAFVLGPTLASVPLASVPANREARLGGAQLLGLAEQAERAGDRRLAERAYRALVGDRQPAIRNEARFRLARLEAARAQWTASATLLRQILDEEPKAARVRVELASILARLGDDSGARRELRAAQAARPPAPLAGLIDRLAETLRDRRPFGADFKVALAPDSNINRATTSDRLRTVIGDFDVDREGKARSGIGLSLEGSAFGRVGLGGGASAIVQAGGRFLRYGKASFGRSTLVARAGLQLAAGSDRVSVTLSGQQHRLGGRVALVDRGLDFAWSRPLSRRTQLRLDGGLSHLDNRFNGLEDSRLMSLSASLDHALTTASGLSIRLSGARRSARESAYSTRSIEAQADGWREFGPLTLTLSAGVGHLRADDALALFPSARSDRSLSAGAGITSRRISWRGLAPSVRVQFERVRSNIAIHDLRRRTVEIGVSRAF